MPPKASGGAGSARRAAGAGASGGGQPGGILKKPVVTSAGAGAAAGQTPGSDRNKVVVRRCPPELPEQVFWQTVEPWIKDDAADWKLVSWAGAERTRELDEDKLTLWMHGDDCSTSKADLASMGGWMRSSSFVAVPC